MKISFINIRNFRKLKNVRIDFSDETTLFVGANNSGKTSAMDALRKFLIKGEGNKFIYNDLIVSNRKAIRSIGEAWERSEAQKPVDLSDWADIVPSMDVWIEVDNTEFHYVAHIIPTLEWSGGKLGVRLSYLPEDIGKLFDAYRVKFQQARSTENSDKSRDFTKKLPPKNLWDFIEQNLNKYFEIKAFILDPAKEDEKQPADFSSECEKKNPFDGLIKIDMIDAQRGLADVDSSNDVVSLSRQFRTYYDRHLDIDKATSSDDLDTLEALGKATDTFNETLKKKFKDALSELESLGYPGITDPKITIESKIKEKTAFEHESAVQYALSDNDDSIRLPEKYNGLGYQNLISIVFRLMSFRDDRIHKGKAASDEGAESIAPLHLVLLEEPEAHLHVQVQQVLIRKAYEVLTKSEVLSGNGFKTQLAVSTHSSHIAKEVEFNQIRYFKRVPADAQISISTSQIINLTNTFGQDNQTEKFVQRYLRVTHCDLFFADAVIFVEGTSENVLVPYFIKNDYSELDSRYITILPIGGRHSHKFKPLIEKLKIPTLIITDLDPAESTGYHKSAMPQRGANLITGNASIQEWGIQPKALDVLLDLHSKDKIGLSGELRVAYQTPVTISVGTVSGEALSATFEDALAYVNIDSITGLTSSKIIAVINDAYKKRTITEFCSAVYEVIHGDSNAKVSFALELMYELSKIEVPPYIGEGLSWLTGKLQHSDTDSLVGGEFNE
jgi:predicted ATP-dependent endonuclease of OLD family